MSAGLAAVFPHGIVPSPQLGARYGLGGSTEARLKLSLVGAHDSQTHRTNRALGGLEAGLNFQPFDSEYVGIFLMPHYRYYHVQEDDDSVFDESYDDESRLIHAFAMPTLLVFHVHEHDLFLGPDVHAGTREHDGFLAMGGHLGTSLAAGRHVRLTMETGLVSALTGPRAWEDPATGRESRTLTVGRLISEFAFSVSWGSGYAPRLK